MKLALYFFMTPTILYVLNATKINENTVCETSSGLKEARPKGFNITIPQGYNKKIPPTKNDCPLVVEVGIYPWKIGDISFQSMSFQVDLYISVAWNDFRLNITAPTMPSNYIYRIFLHDKEASSLWIPLISFRNSMGHTGIKFRPSDAVIRYSESKLSFSSRQVARFHCQFDFSSYPMDVHKCFVEVQALAYKSSVILSHYSTSKGLLSGASPPQFDVSGFEDAVCSRKDGISKYYSCVEYSFIFRRRIAHYIMLTYAPSFLIVLLSWISFWLEVDASPPRVALGLTSLLTLATQFSNAQKDLPPVSYLKAIDVWMFACIFMVFAGLVEFAIVNYLSRIKENIVIPVKEKSAIASEPLVVLKSRSKDKAALIDRISRKLFPIAFLLFNVCYWAYYA